MHALRRLSSVLFVGSALAAPAVWAEPVANWDQERLTKYAEELVTATNELQQAMLGEPSIVSLSQRRAYYEAREDVRLINNSAEHLAAELKAGKGREETMGVYRRISSLRRDAEEEGRRAEIPAATMDKVVKVGSALFKLNPYYAEGVPAPAPSE